MTVKSLREVLGRRPHTVVGVELDTCRLTYGASPCTAAIGTTGEQKCFNTRLTCQDPSNYDATRSPQTGPADPELFEDAQIGGLTLTPGGAGSVTQVQGLGAYPNTVWSAQIPANGYLFSRARSLITPGAFSIALRLNPTTHASPNQTVAGYGNPTTGVWNWRVYYDSGSAHYGHTDSAGVFHSIALPVAGNAFYSIIRSSDAQTIYGQSVVPSDFGPTSLPVPPIDPESIDDARFYIGADDFDGKIFEFHLWDKEISKTRSKQILSNFTSTFNQSVDQIAFWRFTPETQGQTRRWYRFQANSSDAPYLENGYPCLEGVKLSPTRLDPEKGLGRRASIAVNLRDFTFHDRGVDPYVDERTYDVEETGVFLSRLFARHRISLQGRRLVVLRGYLDDSGEFNLQNYEHRQYEIEKVEGPDNNGEFKITAKDPLKRADETKAQAPRASKYSLAADMADSGVSSFTVAIPSGPSANIDDEYPTGTFFVRIDKEVIEVSRTSGSTTLTVVTRGAYRTEITEHKEDDAVQLCLEFVSKRADEIIYDLLVNYANIPAKYIDAEAWEAESSIFIPRVYSALVTEPIGVDKLVNELMSQVPCFVWWDERQSLIQFRALRPAQTLSKTLTDEEHLLADSVVVKELHDKRTSAVIVLHGQIDPTEPLKQARNFAGLYTEADLDSQDDSAYGEPAVEKIFARFITRENRNAAINLSKNLIARYKFSPRQVTFELDAKDAETWTGDIVQLKSRQVASFTGEPGPLTVQIVEAQDVEAATQFRYTGIEYAVGEIEQNLDLFASGKNDEGFNLRQKFEENIGPVFGPVSFRLIVAKDTIIGAPDTNTWAFDTGDWPVGTNIEIVVDQRMRIQGCGGAGGAGGGANNGNAYGNGEDGGGAFKVRYPVTFVSADPGVAASVELYGGGGGGGGGGYRFSFGVDGGGGGGGGAGCKPGPFGGNGTRSSGSYESGFGGGAGTTEAGGAGGTGGATGGQRANSGGAGGGPGQAGGGAIQNSGSGLGTGGAAGAAVEGVSDISYGVNVSPDIEGATS